MSSRQGGRRLGSGVVWNLNVRMVLFGVGAGVGVGVGVDVDVGVVW